MIYDQFATPVQKVWDFVRETAIIIIRFIKEVLMVRLSAWARTVRGFPLVTVIIEKDPFTDEVVPRTMENLIKGFMSLMEGGEEQYNQLKESGAIERTTARIEAAVARLNMTPAYIVQLFMNLWNSFSLNDLAQPIQTFQRILAQFGEPIGRLIAFVVEIIRIVIEVIMQVMNFPSALIGNIITKAMQAFEMIKADPVGFLKNLLKAIKQGFMQFFDNILKHLLAGLVGWLTSELKDSGVKAPEDFSLRGIIGWVLEVLNITMEKIWEKLAAHPRIGPERVARIRSMINTLEGIWTFIKDVQERGMAAIWDKIKEQLTNLWDTVLGAVKNWIMEQIVNRMVTRLLSMLDPTGIMAVVNSAIALYSAIQSFLKYLREMLEIVNSFVEGVVEIASGNTKRAADYLEGTLARSIPVIIGFLANQVGLSGIGRRIGEMIETARNLVDQALTWLVNKAVDTGFAIFDRLMAMGRSAVGAVMGWLGLRKTFTSDSGTNHTMQFRGTGASAALIIESTPMRVEEFLSQMLTSINSNTTLTPQVKQDKLSKIPLARQKVTAIRALTNPTNPTAPQVPNQEQQVTTLVNELSDLIKVIDVSGTSQVVPQAVFIPGFNSSKSHFAEAKYVFKDPVTNRKNHTNGQPARAYRGNLSGALDLINTLGLRSVWVAFHVINEHLGGRAVDSNLVPTPRYINGEFNREFEEPLKAHYLQGKPIWMTAIANYRSDNPDFLDNFQAQGGGMKFEGNTWIEDPSLKLPDFSKSIDLPVVEKISVNRLPSSSADWYLIVNVTPLQGPVLTIIREKGGGALHSKDDIKDLITAHAASYDYTGSYVSNMRGQVDNANLDFSP
jgi:phage-related protein